MDNLKICGFCGESLRLAPARSGSYVAVTCRVCGATGPTVKIHGDGKEAVAKAVQTAVSLWNDRFDDPDSVGRDERLNECRRCGRKFRVGGSTGAAASRRYCSDRCKKDAAEERRKARRDAQNNRKDVAKAACKICGAEFEYKWRGKARTYCSEECRAEGARRSARDFEWRKRERRLRGE